MKILTREELQSKKESFLKYLERIKKEEIEGGFEYEDGDEPYGREEFDEVDWAVILEEPGEVGCILFYHHGDGPERHDRALVHPCNDPANPYIVHGTLRWSGDDEDYYGNISSWVMSLKDEVE